MQIVVRKDNQQYGPYTIEQLRGFIDNGNFTTADMACPDGQNWVQISQLLGLNQGPPRTIEQPTSQRKTSTNRASGNSNAVPVAVISALAGTQGWVRFLSVLGFICFGLIALAALYTLFYGFGGVVASLIYMVFAGLYFFPTLKLSQYASRIASLRHTQSERDLVAALEAQRSFWTFVGIVTAIVLGLYVLLFVITLNFGSVL